MKQLLISRVPEPGAGLVISGPDFHYLHNVRRVRIGQVLTCRTGDGRRTVCRVTRIETDHLVLDRIEETSGSTAGLSLEGSLDGPKTVLHLVQGIPKGKKLEQVVRQATEIGVASITPLGCRHSVADPGERWANKRQHLEGVIREAFQQSGGGCLPSLANPLSPEEYCRGHAPAADELILFLHEKELEQTTLHRYLDPRPSVVTLIIGPEGGFSAEETNLFLRAGYKPVWLGAQVLRTETAAIVALGAVSLLLKESDAWSSRIQENT